MVKTSSSTHLNKIVRNKYEKDYIDNNYVSYNELDFIFPKWEIKNYPKGYLSLEEHINLRLKARNKYKKKNLYKLTIPIPKFIKNLFNELFKKPNLPQLNNNETKNEENNINVKDYMNKIYDYTTLSNVLRMATTLLALYRTVTPRFRLGNQIPFYRDFFRQAALGTLGYNINMIMQKKKLNDKNLQKISERKISDNITDFKNEFKDKQFSVKGYLLNELPYSEDFTNNEYKYQTVTRSYSSFNFNTGINFDISNNVINGTSQDTRIGTEIINKDLLIQLYYVMNPTATTQIFRLLIICDLQPTDTVNYNEIITDPSTVYGIQNIINKDRFLILYDNMLTTNLLQPNVLLRTKIDLQKIKTTYRQPTGISLNVTTNNIYGIIINSQLVDQNPVVIITTRLCFLDP